LNRQDAKGAKGFFVGFIMILEEGFMGSGGRDRSTARLTLGVGLAVSAFPLSVPV